MPAPGTNLSQRRELATHGRRLAPTRQAHRPTDVAARPPVAGIPLTFSEIGRGVCNAY